MHPLWVLFGNVLASVGLMCAADACAQAVEHSTDDTENEDEEWYDWGRTARMGVVGVLSVHYLSAWYHFLDWALPARDLHTVVVKAVVDNIEAVPYYVLLLSSNTLLATSNLSTIPRVVGKELCPLTVISFLIWVPEDILMFSFIPMQYWILVDKCIDLIYLPLMSYIANRSLRTRIASKQTGVLYSTPKDVS